MTETHVYVAGSWLRSELTRLTALGQVQGDIMTVNGLGLHSFIHEQASKCIIWSMGVKDLPDRIGFGRHSGLAKGFVPAESDSLFACQSVVHRWY